MDLENTADLRPVLAAASFERGLRAIVEVRLGGPCEGKFVELVGSLTGWSSDLRRVLGFWRRAPALPVVAAAVAAIGALPELVAPSPAGCGGYGHVACTSGSQAVFGIASIAALPVLLFGVGLWGYERWWYAQLAFAVTPPTRRIWSGSWWYFWRFVRLGLLVSVVSIPVVAASFVLGPQSSTTSVIAIAWFFVVDVLLTFATPALALTTASATEAVRIGVRRLRQLWPSDWPYAFVPPMAVAAASHLATHLLGSTIVTAAVGAVAQWITCWFAGAATLLYLRTTPPAVAAPTPPPAHG